MNTAVDVFNAFDNLTSLREAVDYANSHGGPDTITFAPGVAGGTIVQTGGPLTLSDADLTMIDGGAAGVTLDGNHASNLIQVSGGAAAALNRLIFRNGNAGYGTGGAVFNFGGTLTVDSCSFFANHANYEGGAIFSNGSLTVTASTFGDNTANHGGGIYNSGTLTITNSTFGDNTAQTFGCGIYTNDDLTVTASTLSGNTAEYGGGIFNSGSGTATLTSTIVAGNSGGNLFGTFTDTPTVQTIGYSGSGAPSGSVGQSLSADRRAGTLIFDSFVAHTGLNVPASAGQKDGQFTLGFAVPFGATVFSITVTLRGYAQFPNGAAGSVRLAAEPTSDITVISDGSSQLDLSGPTAQDYMHTTTFTVVARTGNPNGDVLPLTLDALLALTGASGPAQLTIDSMDFAIRSDTPSTAADWGLDPAGLQDNGGPTQTIALLPGSPAIGAGQPGVTTTDQRGQPRKAAPDIGAYEIQIIDTATTVSPSLVSPVYGQDCRSPPL